MSKRARAENSKSGSPETLSSPQVPGHVGLLATQRNDSTQVSENDPSRARRATSAETAIRLDRIGAMMAAGEYRTHLTAIELAAEWGLRPSTVEQMACEASRRLKDAVPDDMFAALTVTDLSVIATEARQTGNYGAAVAAHRLRLEARGLLSQKVDLTLQAVQRATAEELRAELIRRGWRPPREVIETEGTEGS